MSTTCPLPSAQGLIWPELRQLPLFDNGSTPGASITSSPLLSFSIVELLILSIASGFREATLLAFLLTARLDFLALVALGLVGLLLDRLVVNVTLLGVLLLPVDLSPHCLRNLRRVRTFCRHCTLMGRVSRIVSGILPAASSSRKLLIFGVATVVLQSKSPVTLSFFQTSVVRCCEPFKES